jgi:hypothetical protein
LAVKEQHSERLVQAGQERETAAEVARPAASAQQGDAIGAGFDGAGAALQPELHAFADRC